MRDREREREIEERYKREKGYKESMLIHFVFGKIGYGAVIVVLLEYKHEKYTEY